MGGKDIRHLLSLCEEFKHVTVRPGENLLLLRLSVRVPFPVNESFKEPSTKINILLQAYISRLEVQGSLKSDMDFIIERAGDLMRALFEIVLKKGWAQLARRVLEWCKMIDKRMWFWMTPLWQFHGIPIETVTKLEKNSLVQPITSSLLKVELKITPSFQWVDEVHGDVEPFWIIVEDSNNDHIVHHEYYLLKKQYIEESHKLTFTVPIDKPVPPQYCICVVSDRWIHSQTVLEVPLENLILPAEDRPTQLSDMQYLPVTALRKKSFEALYQEFTHFTLVQSQLFKILYKSDKNVLVAAPTGGGKTICAEFAILRNHKEGSGSLMRAVYITPKKALAKQRFSDWKRKFSDGLGLIVLKLTGKTETDSERIERGQIIISTPEQWDALSRSWKQRKHVQQISLLIVDKLHLVGGEGGPIMEVIVSRMRYIASRVENKMRIVALSTPVANAKDLGVWIGATSNDIFNFPPGFRPITLEIYIQGIDFTNFEARMKAMQVAAYTAIVQHTNNRKPAIVFVPTREDACLTAKYLMKSTSFNSGDKPIFLLRSVKELEPFVNRINEGTLKETLKYGIGYLHEGLSSTDQDIIKTLFETGWIQVCVMNGTMCWGVPLTAHLVVVMGTQYYDSKENAQTDYPVTDLLQMMGHASRPLVDNSGKCVIFCHAPRKEYYKKFLYEAFPVESHLHHYIHDNLNAEVVVGAIQNKQDAVEYLRFTFMYRRLTQNPNYYSLEGVSRRHLFNHLWRLVENTLADLEASKCVAIEDDVLLSSLNLGMIASYYYISYTTIERFSSSLTQKTKLKGMLEILASASEYEQLPIRPGEEELIRRLINHQRFSFENPKYSDPHVKANALLQAHFSRDMVGGNLASDQQEILLSAKRLLQAMVDVISRNRWLNSALLVMEMSQMVTQGMWERDSTLLQLPYFTKDLAKKCQGNPEKNVKTFSDLLELEGNERSQLLQMSDTQLMEIAITCIGFPFIDLAHELVNGDIVRFGEDIVLQVTLKQEVLDSALLDLDPEDVTNLRVVLESNRFPKMKKEGWWVVVGGTQKTITFLAFKKLPLLK